MCWNAEVSLQSFLLGITAIIIGAWSGMSLSTLFFCLTIVCMQLVEYVVWTYYSDTEINTLASQSAATLLWLQPIASIFTLQDTTLKMKFLIPYLILTALSFSFQEKKDYTMKRAKNGHLAWNWLTNTPRTYLSLVIYFFFLFGPLLIAGNIELLLLAITTLGISLYTFWRDNTWGSMWCWIVNGIVLLVVGNSVLFKT